MEASITMVVYLSLDINMLIDCQAFVLIRPPSSEQSDTSIHNVFDLCLLSNVNVTYVLPVLSRPMWLCGLDNVCSCSLDAESHVPLLTFRR